MPPRLRKIMIFQHVGHEPLGTLNPMLKAAGFRIRYINFGRHPDLVPSLEGYSGLIVLGGPMGVYESDKINHLKVEMTLIEQALKQNIPVLGICLGAQMIASVLSADVRPAQAAEVGWYDIHLTNSGGTDPLFQNFKNPEKIFQLHQDMFDLPKSAVHLASSDLCPGQAFRYGNKVYGFQFHLEADQAMILRWLQRPENKKMIEKAGSHVTSEGIVQETGAQIARSLELSSFTFGQFIQIFQLPERAVVLGSSHGKPPKPNA